MELRPTRPAGSSVPDYSESWMQLHPLRQAAMVLAVLGLVAWVMLMVALAHFVAPTFVWQHIAHMTRACYSCMIIGGIASFYRVGLYIAGFGVLLMLIDLFTL
jgi:hypothetical protein